MRPRVCETQSGDLHSRLVMPIFLRRFRHRKTVTAANRIRFRATRVVGVMYTSINSDEFLKTLNNKRRLACAARTGRLYPGGLPDYSCDRRSPRFLRPRDLLAGWRCISKDTTSCNTLCYLVICLLNEFTMRRLPLASIYLGRRLVFAGSLLKGHCKLKCETLH